MSALPWHEAHWRSLVARHRDHRLPHALLLAGPAGLGKVHFARAFAQMLLCERPDPKGHPCNACQGCHLFSVGNHPDLKVVEPAEAGKAILVDQIRDVIDYLSLRPHYAPLKITLVAPAEQMNVNAANSLLKSLEEPPEHSLLILVSHRPVALLPTIRSRCQRIAFAKPERERALAWLVEQGVAAEPAQALLALADGAPMSALAWADSDLLPRRRAAFGELESLRQGRESPSGVAERWLKSGISEPLYWLASWTMDMCRLKAAERVPYLANPDLEAPLRSLAQSLDTERLHRFLDKVTAAVRLARTPANPQLLVEDVLVEWIRIDRPVSEMERLMAI